MSVGDIGGASRPSRLLLVSSVIIWIAIAIGLPLAALTLNAFRIASVPAGFWGAAEGVSVLLILLVALFAWRAGGKDGAGAARAGIVLAGEAVGAAAIIGFATSIAALGYDGLALPLGLVAGMALLAIVIAPRFVLYPSRSISGFFAIRYGGAAPRRVALIIAFFATALLLAADLKAAARAVQVLGTITYGQAVGGVAIAITLVWLVASYLVARQVRGLGYIAVCAGIGLTVGALSYATTGSPIPHVALGDALKDYAALNQTLVIKHITDFQSLVPMTSPFLQLPMRNFAGLLLAVALGIAAAPHLLGRHLAQAVTPPGGAVKRAAVAVVAVAVLASCVAPLAVFSRLGVEQTMAKGIESAAIPETLTRLSDLKLVKICGETSSDQAALTAACSKEPGQHGFLRMQDVAFADDALVVTAPAIAGLPPSTHFPLLVAALLATLIVGKSLMQGLAAADAEVRQNVLPRPIPVDVRTFLVCASAIGLGTAIAMTWAVGATTIAIDGFALLAAGLLPALVLGLYWRRMNGRGAFATMVAGSLIVVLYLVGVHFWPVELFRLTWPLSNADPAAARRFLDLDAAWRAAGDPQSQALGRAALELHATKIANWGGLVPGAIVLIAVPAAVFIGALVSLMSKKEDKPTAA